MVVPALQGARLHLIWVDRAGWVRGYDHPAPLLINRFWQNCFTLRRASLSGPFRLFGAG
jgi:hypothetical protein